MFSLSVKFRIPFVNPFYIFVVRIILSALTLSCWRFLQRRISFNFGSQVAFLFFLSEIFNWNTLHQSSRFTEDNLIRSIGNNILVNLLYLLFTSVVLICFGLIIEKKYLFSLSLLCLSLPILRENSLNLLSSFLPLFLNREVFETDPLAMFSFLSVSGIVMAIDPKHPYLISSNNFMNLKNPLALLSVVTILSGLIHRNFLVLKLTFVHLIGNFVFESPLNNSIYFPFLAVSLSLSFSQNSSKTTKKTSITIHPKLETIGIQLFAVFLGILFMKNSFKSIDLSPGGRAALKLNDFLISESKSCPGVIKAHISKSAQSLGFSKFSSIIDPKISLEFGSIYTDDEMIQKFKYRVADINENFDPAYWRVRRVISGIESLNENKVKLQVKILTRAQAE